MTRQKLDTIFREIRECFKIPQYVAYIRKLLFMLLLNSVQSLTVLTFCAQWMCLAALLFHLVSRFIDGNIIFPGKAISKIYAHQI